MPHSRGVRAGLKKRKKRTSIPAEIIHCWAGYVDTQPCRLQYSWKQDDKDNQLQEMMATFAYDAENPAEKQAQECKDKGNAAYMKGPEYYANALKHYSVRA